MRPGNSHKRRRSRKRAAFFFFENRVGTLWSWLRYNLELRSVMSFFEWVKVFELKPRYLLAVWLFGALLLLLPAYVSERFGFASIVTHYRGWIGLGTLAFFVL